nr:putative integron gene cassette protein [uncultured bacterium]CAP49118.1 putative integron gene cassette protein [uncultured bacterium]CAP49119.1 putative integron gene cassette protein [uncultured bacterium]
MALLGSIPVENWISWAIVAASMIHVAEEYLGGWIEWVQKYAQGVKASHFVIVNSIFIATCIAASMSTSNFFKLTIASLIFVNAIIHIVPTVVFKHYSPGLWSAVFLYIPISSYSYYSAAKNWELSASITILTILSGMLLMLIPITAQRIRIRLTEQEGLKRERHDVE